MEIQYLSIYRRPNNKMNFILSFKVSVRSATFRLRGDLS